ncbi:MAG TPA: EAL domain-containing protein [Acidimicrobiales bacterium]|nr:EAL domain-containing protein [Acidimicrobiales bacterium]
MRKPPPTTADIFIAKKRSRARIVRRVQMPSGPSGSAIHPSKRERREAEQVLEERNLLIRRTIANRSLETHFQPIVNLRSGTMIGTEALSRFPDGPRRTPDVWFAEAASVGLGVDLEVTAVEMALAEIRSLPSELYLSLNASVETIVSEDFRAILDGAPAERIVLELTEHTPVANYREFAQEIEWLRSAGVRLAVDDAGSGFSSFNHILNLKPDIIKLDISLTRGIDKDPARQALGRALLNFGLEAYRTTIVAEGIETAGELETLRSLGCPSGQGFILGRPSRRVSPPQLLPAMAPPGTSAPAGVGV